MKRQSWLKLRKKTDGDWPDEPPILLGNKSNGEFFHEQTPLERKLRKEILTRSAEAARHVGMDRREFLASTMGMCTSLAVLNLAAGCGSDSSGTTGKGGTGGGGGQGGGYAIPDAALYDHQTADAACGGGEFILDMQTHHIEDEAHWTARHPGAYPGTAIASFLTFYDCVPKAVACIGPDTYVDKIFLESDTTVSVLSGFPTAMCADGTLCTSVTDNDGMAFTRDRVNAAAGGTQRMVQHCQVDPNDKWDLQAAMMERIRSQYGNHGWKVYPPWGPGGGNSGWWLDDPVVADPFFEKAKALGDPIVCAHKGFPLPTFDAVYADPKDVGPAAVKHPDVKFVIYHSAFDTAAPEAPYDPAGGGVNRLIKTIVDNDLYGKNVYAEMGSAWVLTMNDPVRAQHYVGKLLKYVGEDNVLWGSECVWFGSPQPQIEMFRCLEISKAFQDQYGYPELTPERKAKIFGLNAARLYAIDPMATRKAVDKSALASWKRELDGELGGRRWALQQPGGPRTRREFMSLIKWRKFLGVPA